MKRVSYFLVIISVLIAACQKKDIGIGDPSTNINYPYFIITDTAFFDALIDIGIDADGDGLIINKEAEIIKVLDLSCLYSGNSFGRLGQIKNLKGIEAFINLDTAPG